MAVDLSKYEDKRRGVNDQFAAQTAANDFGRFTSQQRFGRNKADYTRDFGRSHSPFMGNMAQRGLTGGGIQSGAFQQALQRRVGDYTQGQGRMAEDFGNEQRQYDLGQAQIQSYRTNALADIEAEQQRELAMAALNIKALRPLFGA